MGPAEHMPELPHFEFLQVPSSNYYVSKFRAEGNWLQSLEGECDSGHVGFLHRYLQDRKSTRLNSSHMSISYAVFCLKKKKEIKEVSGYSFFMAQARMARALFLRRSKDFFVLMSNRPSFRLFYTEKTTG